MGLMDNIFATAPKRLTSEIIFSDYFLIVDAYSKILNIYGMQIITFEEVTDKLDKIHSIFGRIDEFGWWDLEIILAYAGTQFTSMEFQ